MDKTSGAYGFAGVVAHRVRLSGIDPKQRTVVIDGGCERPRLGDSLFIMRDVRFAKGSGVYGVVAQGAFQPGIIA